MPSCLALVRCCPNVLKNCVLPRHVSQEMRRREEQSGGVGADPVLDSRPEATDTAADGDIAGQEQGRGQRFKAGIHTWGFCQGKVYVLLWNDVFRPMAGGDSVIADTVFPDISLLSKTSLPGGTGTRSTLDGAVGKASSTPRVKSEEGRDASRKRCKKGSPVRDDILAILKALAVRQERDAIREVERDRLEAARDLEQSERDKLRETREA